MKDWILPFLRSKGDERISLQQLEREISIPTFAARRLTDLFLHNFWGNEHFRTLFGLTLGALPQEIFCRLLRIRNLFFFLNTTIASVNPIGVSERNLTAYIVIFSGELLPLRDAPIQGAIAHEFGHLVLDHHKIPDRTGVLCGRSALEVEADAIACQWGFECEIDTIRAYLKSKGENHVE